jgi:HTH-type transcriptional regulator/antitoxin HigA
MQAAQSRFDIRAIQTSWAKLDAMAHIRPIHDEAGYDRMVALMNELLDEVGDNEEHKLAGLLELVGDLVSNYEREHLAIETSEPKDALRFLIEAKGLKQEDLSDIVAQGNLSNILAGRRKISATLAGKLGEFFGVSSALFIPKA